MNLIHIVLLIGVWLFAIMNVITFINARDDFIKSNEKEKPKELIKAQKALISSLLLAVIYTVAKIS